MGRKIPLCGRESLFCRGILGIEQKSGRERDGRTTDLSGSIRKKKQAPSSFFWIVEREGSRQVKGNDRIVSPKRSEKSA